MPVMGADRDHELPRLVTERLRRMKPRSFSFWTAAWSVGSLENLINDALKEQTGVKPESWHRTRQVATIVYTLLYGRNFWVIDWTRFQSDLDEILWQFDAADF